MSVYTDWHKGNKVIQVKDNSYDQFWSNADPDHLQGLADTYSSISLSISPNENRNITTSIVVSDFRFELPEYSEIEGIEVRISRVADYSADNLYKVKDITSHINTEYEYPPLDKDGGKYILNSGKAFKLENWDILNESMVINKEEDAQYPNDSSVFETVVLGGKGILWGLPLSKLNRNVLNSEDLFFSTKTGVFGYYDVSKMVKVAINNIEMRILYNSTDDEDAPIG